MGKLNQVVAVVPSLKKNAHEAKSEAHHKLKVKDLLMGLTRTYEPKLEGGDKMPSESKNVQYSVSQAIKDYSGAASELYDAVYSQEATNAIAKTDLKVNGKVILTDVPVTFLLFLEKQAQDALTFASELPTLDPAFKWEYDSSSDHYKAEPVQTLKTRKTPFNHVKAEADEHHPAQVDVYYVDVAEGTYTKTEFSGAISAKEKNEMVARARAFLIAVKKAKEEANLAEAIDVKVGQKILDFVFKG